MRAVAVGAAVLLLAGCSAADPSAASSTNETACDEFAAATLNVAQTVIDGDDIDIAATYDEIALTASGDVKTRILHVIDELPDPDHMILWIDNRDHYSETLESVQRACASEGHTINVAVLVAGG